MSRFLWTCAAPLICTVVCAVPAWPAAGSAEEKLQLSGRRNGTVHGPGSALRSTLSFVPLRTFGPRCFDYEGGCERGGFDHIVGAAGLRNAGFGTLRLRGAPNGAHLVAAYLYVGMIENLDHGGGLPGLPWLTFNGFPVDTKLIARHGKHCWEASPGQLLAAEATLYRGDVTGLLSPDINGDYLVAGATSGVTDGSDPFRCLNAPCQPILPLAQGATVVAVFQHLSVPGASMVFLHEARGFLPQLISGLGITQTLTPSGPLNWKQLRFTSIGGDGQTRDPDPIFEPVAPLSTALQIGGSSAEIRGAASRIEPNADWIGLDGGTLPQLWDTRTTVVYRHELTPDGSPPLLTEYTVGYGALLDEAFDYDCVNPSAHVLSLYAEP